MKNLLVLVMFCGMVFSLNSTIELKSGWNLISSPIADENGQAHVVSTTCNIHTIYLYNRETNTYETNTLNVGDTVPVSRSFWAKSNAPCKITFSGANAYTYDGGLALGAGWNGFGGPYNNIIWADLVGDCNVISGPWLFNTIANSWQRATILEPGYGYMIRVSNNCSLGTVVSTPPTLPVGKTACVVPVDGMVITKNTTFCAGTYRVDGGVTVNTSNVVLDCNGATLISTTKEVFSNGVSVMAEPSAITLSGVSVENCILDGYGYGIKVFNAHLQSDAEANSLNRALHVSHASNYHHITIKNNTVHAAYTGIYVAYAANLTLQQNTITAEKQDGIELDYAPDAKIYDNKIESYNAGIQGYGTDAGTIIKGNDIHTSGFGVAIFDIGTSITGNHISLHYNGYNYSEGILVKSYTCFSGTKPAYTQISGNTFTDLATGIDVELLRNDQLNQSFVSEYQNNNQFQNVGRILYQYQNPSLPTYCR